MRRRRPVDPRSAAIFVIASGVHGYADKEECDDNHQRCDDDLHGYNFLND